MPYIEEITLEDLCPDRRKLARQPQLGSAVYFSDGHRMKARTIELDEDGGRLMAERALRRGEVIAYNIVNEGGQLRSGTARIVWVDPLPGGQSIAGFFMENHSLAASA